MSIGFDPVVGSVLFSAGLIPHVAPPRRELELPTVTPETPPLVTVILALYRERWDDIDMTLESLLKQTYPKERLEVLVAIEAHDQAIHPLADRAVRKLRDAGIGSAIVMSHGGKRLKAYALNLAIERAHGDICAFYDASDDIEPAQIERAALLMHEKHYDAVQATVLRKGRSILSEFLFIDTAFWFRKYLPFVLGLAKGMPLSGEGLFLRRAVLNEVGGFPEVLTEDAYLGILLTERDKRFGLVSSVITEKAPRSMKAHFIQRLRWNRGYLTCLARLVRSDLSWKRKGALSLPFLTPLSCALAFVGWLLIVGQWGLSVAGGFQIPDVTLSVVPHTAYSNAMYYWALTLFVVGIPMCVVSYVHTLWVLGLKRSVPFVMMLPYYWTFIGFAATCSFFKNTTHWGKTER
ncbi:MAG TPA: glycosyltransferase family 2 protein [Vicinamibacterales bacterium]|nr:glycosyltransferase family 2 protein [Vicinamibacterales bacterium]